MCVVFFFPFGEVFLFCGLVSYGGGSISWGYLFWVICVYWKTVDWTPEEGPFDHVLSGWSSAWICIGRSYDSDLGCGEFVVVVFVDVVHIGGVTGPHCSR